MGVGSEESFSSRGTDGARRFDRTGSGGGLVMEHVSRSASAAGQWGQATTGVRVWTGVTVVRPRGLD